MKWNLILIFLFILISPSCIKEGRYESDQDEVLIERIGDLEGEIEGLQEDFYIAYMAIQQIDSLNNLNDTTGIRETIEDTRTQLGDIRFFQIDNVVCDILTQESIDIDPENFRFFRELRQEDYLSSRTSFLRDVDKHKNDTSINIIIY